MSTPTPTPSPSPSFLDWNYPDVFDFSTDPRVKCGLLHFGIFRPECWAQTYQQAQYGNVPTPTPATVDTAPAPQTAGEMKTWTPDDARAAAVASWGQKLRDAIAAAEASGDYTPGGRLPFDGSGKPNLEWWRKYGVYVAAVGAGFALLLIGSNGR